MPVNQGIALRMNMVVIIGTVAAAMGGFALGKMGFSVAEVVTAMIIVLCFGVSAINNWRPFGLTPSG